MRRGKTWTPKRGDVIWVNFDPQAGHEQAGHRPALVLSVDPFNATGTAIVCPITSRVRGHNLEVPLPAAGKVEGVVLSHQVKTIDWRVRGATLAQRVDPSVVEQVIHRLKLLCGMV